jgi:hypothetical protein
MDIAKTILDNVDADPRHKALAQHAFEVAPHEHALAQMLHSINIPQDAKADLWDAKRNSVHDPKITKLYQVAALPKAILDTLESHPNIMKFLMTEEKSAQTEKPKSESKVKEPQAKEPKGDKNRMWIEPSPQAPQSEKTFDPSKPPSALPFTLPIDQPPHLPAEHAHVRASDGSEHIVPNRHLDAIKQADPEMQILNQA